MSSSPAAALAESLYPWLCERVRSHAAGPVRLGLNGPQGSGKSTLAAALVARAAREGRRWVALSIDDVYLRRAEQAALAARWPDDPLLAVRGGPGTHDVALGAALLDALAAPSGALRLPRYDKAAYAGRGDRRAEAEWPEVALPVELVVFEGWLLGFSPLGAAAPPALAAADARLAPYAAWTRRLLAMVQLRAPSSAAIRAWRVQAEAGLRAEGRGGMGEAEAAAYIERFLPFYAVYPDALAAAPPVPAWHRVVALRADRAAEG